MRVSLFRVANAALPSAVLLAVLFNWARKLREPTSEWTLSKQPPCETLEHEFARLNEFLAYSQFVCNNLALIGEGALQFSICTEPPYGIDLNRTGFLLVSFANDQDGLRLEHALLERNAGKVRFVDGMLAPQRFHGRMSFFGTWDQFLTRLRKRQVIDVMKVDCVTCWLPEAQLQLLRELVACGALGRVRLLILVIRLDESNSLLLRDWYETLSSMFFEYSMAVYVAKQSGDCSASFGSCKYTIGFVNVNGSDHTSVRVPVAGLGSAEEELLRLHHFLSNPRHICPTTVFSVTNESCYGCESWTTCSFQGYNQQCAVLYFGFAQYGDCAKAYSLMKDVRCTVYVFDPLCKQRNDTAFRVHFYNTSHLDYNADRVLSLLPAGIVIDKIFVDLQGSEWDVLGEMLITEPFKIARQILLRINLWTGEESDNVRRMFAWLYFCTKAGWQPFHVEQREEYCEQFAFTCRQRAYLQVGMIKA
uniref:Methyltransferase domain-containing protein n=1 Tax=Trichuris muris TaxID=70415 RepID=A0A5S6QYQ5_TRIMR